MVLSPGVEMMTVAMGDHSGWTPPSIDEFLPDAIAFQGTLFEFNRINLVQWVALLVIVIVFMLYAFRAKLVPGRAQSIVEMLLEFVRKNIAQEVIGKVSGLRYAPLLTVIFITILFMNLTGLVPGLNIAGTVQIAMPIVLAMLSYVVFIGAGIKAQGALGFFKNSLFPPGVPWPIYIVLTPIEALSTFVIRPFTLIIRLLANMVSGHMLMALCFLATNFLIIHSGSFGLQIAGVGTFLVAVAFVFFEAFIAALQAYIFTVLSAAYINLSIHAH